MAQVKMFCRHSESICKIEKKNVFKTSLPNPLKPGVIYLENEDAVGAAPTGDAPTASEWSTILLPTKVWLMLKVWQQF